MARNNSKTIVSLLQNSIAIRADKFNAIEKIYVPTIKQETVYKSLTKEIEAPSFVSKK